MQQKETKYFYFKKQYLFPNRNGVLLLVLSVFHILATNEKCRPAKQIGIKDSHKSNKETMNPNLGIPDFSRIDSFQPKANVEFPIKSIHHEMAESLAEMRGDLASVRKELEVANKKAEEAKEQSGKAEQKVDQINRKMYRISLASFLVPFMFGVWQYVEAKQLKTKEEARQVSVDSLIVQVQNLQAELSITRKIPTPAKPLSGTIAPKE